MKELYISDLDGTLLNRSAELSSFTVTVLNRLIAEGLHFSVSTARTAATVLHILKDVHINIPVSLMNGVSIYDISAKRYLKTEFIPPESAANMIDILRRHRQTGFLYGIEGDCLTTFYENTDSEHRRAFLEERVRKYGKLFTKVSSFRDCLHRSLIYLSVSDRKERLEPVYEEMRTDPNLHIEFYRDIYMDQFWYFEVCSAQASKYNAAMYLRDRFGFERIVSFGDNLNDLPLFLASDESHAVGNAKEEVKRKADSVILSNEENGVARYLMKQFQIDTGGDECENCIK